MVSYADLHNTNAKIEERDSTCASVLTIVDGDIAVLAQNVEHEFMRLEVEKTPGWLCARCITHSAVAQDQKSLGEIREHLKTTYVAWYHEESLFVELSLLIRHGFAEERIQDHDVLFQPFMGKFSTWVHAFHLRKYARESKLTQNDI